MESDDRRTSLEDDGGKAKELKEAFKQAGVDIEIKTNADLDNPPHPIESGHTFEANAKIKAHELPTKNQTH